MPQTSKSESGALVATQSPSRSPQRNHNDMPPQTQRSMELTLAADQLLTSPASNSRRISWMGPSAVVAVDVDAHDPSLDVQARIVSRNRRAKMIREMRSFLEHVKNVLGDTVAPVPHRADDPPEKLEPEVVREQEEVASQTQKARVESGELLISAYDGTAHDEAELISYNAFVHDAMANAIREEVRREKEGEMLSLCSGNDGRSSRRPELLPNLDQWNRLPRDTDDQGKPLDAATVKSSRKQYNQDALHESRRLLGYRCFRRFDFAAMYERQKTGSPAEVTTPQREASESPQQHQPQSQPSSPP